MGVVLVGGAALANEDDHIVAAALETSRSRERTTARRCAPSIPFYSLAIANIRDHRH